MKVINKQQFWELKPPFIFSRWCGGSREGLYECFEFLKKQ